MKGYKGFEKGMICKGKKYAENTVFEENEAVICEKGMHFCKRPLDVLDYYAPTNNEGELNEFAEVEALDECKTDDEIKYCTKKLKEGAKIGLVGLINAGVEYIKTEIIPINKNKKRSAAVNSGYRSVAVNSGYSSAAETTGEESVSIALGIDGKAKAAKGSWITIAEWKEIDFKWHRINVKTVKVDGKRIKANTFYKLVNGKFVEDNSQGENKNGN